MTFAHPPENRYFEDYVPGAVHEFGSIAVDEQEVIEFARRYVPLSYHVDKEAAQKSIYGGLIAQRLANRGADDARLYRGLPVPRRQSGLAWRR